LLEDGSIAIIVGRSIMKEMEEFNARRNMV